MGTELKPKNRKAALFTLIAGGVFLLGAALIPLLVRGQTNALQAADVVLPPVVMDHAAPQLSLTDLQGSPVSLVQSLGKVVLVNNWATWCPPCQAEMPELQSYFQAHRFQGFLVVAIESGEPADTVQSFVQQYELTFPVWLDPKGSALDAFRNWDLPSSYVVDRQGILRLGWTGPLSRAVLEKYVTPLLVSASQ